MQTELFQTQVAFCQRCGRPCQPGDGSPEARLLRRAKRGFCVNCAVTQFLQTTVPLNSVLAARGPEMLRDERVQRQFISVMQSGHADAEPVEIDWAWIIDRWGVPFP